MRIYITISFRNLVKKFLGLCLLLIVSLPLFAQNTSSWDRLGPFGGPVINIREDGHGILWATGYEGLFRSHDGGQTWQLPIRLQATGQLAVNDSIIVVGFSGGTLTSFDYGSHWNTFHFNNKNGTPNDLAIHNDTLYLTADYFISLGGNRVSSEYPSGILQSTDMGETWHSYALSSDFIPHFTINRYGRFYTITDAGEYIRYSNNASKWDTLRIKQKYGVALSLVTVADTATFFGTINDLYRISGKNPSVTSTGLHTNATLLYSDKDRLFVASGDTLYWSEDLGASWHTSFPDASVNDVITRDGDILSATTQQGLIRQSAGSNSWISSNTGLSIAPMTDASSFTVSRDDSIFAGVSYNGVKRYEGNGTWSYMGPDSVTVTSVASSTDGTLYALSGNSLYRRSTKDYKWQKESLSNLSPYKHQRLFIPADGILYLQRDVDSGKPVYRSVDKGVHWDSLFTGKYIQQLVSDGNGRLYAAMSDTYSSKDEILYLSVDSGSTWQSHTTTKIKSIYRWGKDSLLAGTVYDGVVVITDNGTKWNRLGDPGNGAIGLVVGDTNGYVFAYSWDNQKAYTWSIDNPEWQTIAFPDLSYPSSLSGYSSVLIDSQHKVIIWGMNRGIYRSNVNTFILPVNRDNVDLPLQISLHQNYPNPFNPTTTIKYELIRSGPVRLIVYNVLGQRVSVLVNARQSAGSHQVTFNAMQLTSGVYFYRLQASDRVLVKKMLLMK